MGKTLFERVWEAHLVADPPDEAPLLFVDLHLVHEVTSAQAFEGLRIAWRRVRRPDLTLATMDHNVPTDDRPGTTSPPRSSKRSAATAMSSASRCTARGAGARGSCT